MLSAARFIGKLQKCDHVIRYYVRFFALASKPAAHSVWSRFSGLAVPTWSSTSLPKDLCRPVSGTQGSRSLRSAEKGVLVVPFAASTAFIQNRAFSEAGPRVWNDLPQELRLFPRLCTYTFLGQLKIYLLSALELGALLCSHLEGALYKILNE